MWTKGELISAAFEEIGIASYQFDVTPEERVTALNRLDTMMATWEGKNIHVGYLFPPLPGESDENDPSGMPDEANETVFLNLAKRLAPGFGKQVSADTKVNAREGYDTLLRRAAFPQQQQMPGTMPVGAGNKPWRSNYRTFFPTPVDDPVFLRNDLDTFPE